MRASIDVEVKWDEDLEKGEIIFDVVFLYHFHLSCSFIFYYFMGYVPPYLLKLRQ